MNEGLFMNTTIPEYKKIAPYLVFFTVHTMQIGIGILGFQRVVAEVAGYDGWISVILAGAAIHILLWMIFIMVDTASGDMDSIHTYVFGKNFSKFLNFFIMIYFCLLTVTVIRNFIEIVQVWMFQRLETFWFAVVFLLAIIYIIYGGFRTITGICFYSVVLPSYIVFTFLFTIPLSDFTNLLPIMDHSVTEILQGSREMTLSVIGYETLLIYYPFIQYPKKAKKWAHWANLYTTFIYLYLALITYAYFSETQLQKNIWPTLTMWKIIKLPFVERFEYIGIANWFIAILPNAALALWCASRISKQLFGIRQKTAVPILAVICLIGICLLTTREQINQLDALIGKIGFYFNFIYIPLLFLATLIAKKVKKHVKDS
jgi:spore germination protein AB